MKHSLGRRYLFAPLFLLLLIVLVCPFSVSPATPTNQLRDAWERARAVGSYTFTADIEQTPGQPLPERGDVIFPEIVVQPQQEVEREVNLLRLYDMRRTGPYSIRGRIDWRGKSFLTGKAYLDIVPGFEIAKTVALSVAQGG